MMKNNGWGKSHIFVKSFYYLFSPFCYVDIVFLLFNISSSVMSKKPSGNGIHSRTTQLFIALEADNDFGTESWETP